MALWQLGETARNLVVVDSLGVPLIPRLAVIKHGSVFVDVFGVVGRPLPEVLTAPYGMLIGPAVGPFLAECFLPEMIDRATSRALRHVDAVVVLERPRMERPSIPALELGLVSVSVGSADLRPRAGGIVERAVQD